MYKSGRYILPFILFFLSSSSIVQSQDSSTNVSEEKDSRILHDVHVGVGSQKALFAGPRLIVGSLFIGADVGYNFFSSDKYLSFSATVGWLPSATIVDNGPFYSLIGTGSIYGSELRYSFFTANIGWLSQHSKGISYAFTLGGGLKLSSTPVPNTENDYTHMGSFFINLEGSVGFAF